MLSAPTFSAVIAAYNAASTVQSAIRSVVAQTRTDWELIVVDDGSTDATMDRCLELAGDDRVRCLQQENQGPAAARNLGIASARGSYISFLDSDDLWMPRYLEAMGGALDAEPSAGLAFTDAYSLDDVSRKIYKATAMSGADPPIHPPRDHEVLLRRLVRKNFILTSATVRATALQKVGSFDPTLHTNEDYELWLRIVRDGFGVVRPPGLLAIHRARHDSLSTDLWSMTVTLIDVLSRVLADERLSDEVHAIARRQIRQLERTRAAMSDGHPVLSSAYRLRQIAGTLRRRVRGPRPTYESPPAEVANAFPDLGSV